MRINKNDDKVHIDPVVKPINHMLEEDAVELIEQAQNFITLFRLNSQPGIYKKEVEGE